MPGPGGRELLRTLGRRTVFRCRMDRTLSIPPSHFLPTQPPDPLRNILVPPMSHFSPSRAHTGIRRRVHVASESRSLTIPQPGSLIPPRSAKSAQTSGTPGTLGRPLSAVFSDRFPATPLDSGVLQSIFIATSISSVCFQRFKFRSREGGTLQSELFPKWMFPRLRKPCKRVAASAACVLLNRQSTISYYLLPPSSHSPITFTITLLSLWPSNSA
jgi:hypothetical protein